MHEFQGTATQSVGATPDAVFRLITDVDRLPEWNRAVECVVEQAPELAQGTEWTVKMHPMRGMSWQSRSRVEQIDRETRTFTYRTWNTDGNPSYADWKWEVVPLDSNAQVSVSWDVHLETLDRRLLGGPLRQRQLRKEVAASLLALDEAVRNA